MKFRRATVAKTVQVLIKQVEVLRGSCRHGGSFEGGLFVCNGFFDQLVERARLHSTLQLHVNFRFILLVLIEPGLQFPDFAG